MPVQLFAGALCYLEVIMMAEICWRRGLLRSGILVFLLIVWFAFASPAIGAKESGRSRDISALDLQPEVLNVTVHFIDVGFGDSIFIETSGKNVLIDGGLPGAGKNVLDYLESLNVTRIDLMIATHPHEDHVGGLLAVLNSSVKVDRVLFNNDTETRNSQELYDEFLALARDHNLTLACRGQIYTLAEAVDLTVLNPEQPLRFTQPSATIDEDIVNENSIVVKLDVGNVSYMFTGDAESRAEQNMLEAGLDLGSDVLKVGHHGLRGTFLDANTVSFLERVMPSYAVVTACTPNKYGLVAPHPETIDRLLEVNASLFGTQVNGTIKTSTDGNAVDFPDGPVKSLVTGVGAHAAAVYTAAWSPKGNLLATGSRDGTVRLWNTATWNNVLTINAQIDSVWSVAWSPDGTKLATAGMGGASVWNPQTGSRLTTLNLTQSLTTYSISWSPDGKMTATGDSGGLVTVSDSGTGETLKQLQGHTFPVISTGWSPDGSRLASGSIDRSTIIWDTLTWSEECALRTGMPSSRNDINGLAWSPDGTLLATAGQEGNVHVWDPETQTEIRVLPAHLGWARGVAWSPDGQTLATTGQDACIRLWNPETGELLSDLREHRSPVWGIAWSPEGSLLASVSGKYQSFGGDTRVLIWGIHEHLETDLSWDGKVDMRDVALIAAAFGMKPGDPKWNLMVDLDKSGTVDMEDVDRVAGDFGRHALQT